MCTSEMDDRFPVVGEQLAGMPPSASSWQAPCAFTVTACVLWLSVANRPVHWPNCVADKLMVPTRYFGDSPLAFSSLYINSAWSNGVPDWSISAPRAPLPRPKRNSVSTLLRTYSNTFLV